MSTMKVAVTGERVVQKKKEKSEKIQRDHVHHGKAVTRKKVWVPENEDMEAQETMSTIKVAVTGERVVQKKQKNQKKNKGTMSTMKRL